MQKIDQKIYALQLTDREAKALVALLRTCSVHRGLRPVCKRLEKIMDQIGDEQ